MLDVGIVLQQQHAHCSPSAIVCVDGLKLCVSLGSSAVRIDVHVAMQSCTQNVCA